MNSSDQQGGGADQHPTPPGKKKIKNYTSDPMATKARNFESTSRFSASAICKRIRKKTVVS
jgi:hypothetical protein